MLLHVSRVDSLLPPNAVPLCARVTICLSLLLLMDTWAVSRGWPLWVRLLYTFSHKSACRPVFSLLLGKESYLGEDQLSQRVGPCLTLWETAELFSKVVSIFPSHQQRAELWFSLSSTTLSTISLFVFSYPSGYEVISHILVVFVWATWWPVVLGTFSRCPWSFAFCVCWIVC